MFGSTVLGSTVLGSDELRSTVLHSDELPDEQPDEQQLSAEWLPWSARSSPPIHIRYTAAGAAWICGRGLSHIHQAASSLSPGKDGQPVPSPSMASRGRLRAQPSPQPSPFQGEGADRLPGRERKQVGSSALSGQATHWPEEGRGGTCSSCPLRSPPRRGRHALRRSGG